MSARRPPSLALRRRRLGVYWIFAINGIAFATWMARVPGLRDNLAISTAEVGLFLLGGAVGALSGLALSSHIIAWLGSRRTIAWFALLSLVAIGGVGVLSAIWPSLALAMAAMFVFGVGASVTDVAMNVEGAEVERDLERNIMPWFHALFSLGTAVGGGLAAVASSLSIGVEYHFVAVALVLVGPVMYSVRLMGHTNSGADTEDTDPDQRGLKSRLSVWAEGRTLLIGVVALSMAFAEGSANDWLALAMVDDRGYTNAEGALWFVLFTGSMTLGRFLGVPLLDRFGRVPILAGSGLAALLGLATVITLDGLVVGVMATIAWGVGSALGFPVAMSAAADDPQRGAARVSAVATIAYGAFLVGPPLIGGLAEATGILTALWVVAAVIALGLLATPATRKPSA
ncbi:MFS transporter [Pontimonas sp.]|uniref:MFS transporter n=1 Tax=Pontimonas sp. TaxID=2304492 RepID=UPI00287065FC|nr:MFS transporter [Pontimonas sp.]MDR9396523.1 MFS transporter [Pontimonas sp.]MDR9434174.1 MFS transporter [Pontimonas sp.]